MNQLDLKDIFLQILFAIYLENKKRLLYLHPHYRGNCFYWRNGRAVECGSLENC
jgi:hypothetical protein